jgi:serine/threonine protein kinase
MTTTPIPFGRYLLVERVAIGGMAEVFAAVERGDRAARPYAVKRMLPTLTEDRELVRMFLDEARLVVQLDHPGIVPVHELGKLGSGYYIVMDWVAGRDLGALAGRFRGRGARLPVELAALVAFRLADALDHAHRGRGADGRELRVVHRDVSPANVLVGFDGTVRIIDFGIAQVAHRPPGGAPVLRGKFGYMSPEMVRGLPVDRRSDVFAAGVVLHELLTGERLFTGATELAVMEKVRGAEPAPPSGVNRAVPPELDAIVLRALAREPEARFGWASELRDALAPWMPRAQDGGASPLARLMAETFPDGVRAEEERWARARASLRHASPG